MTKPTLFLDIDGVLHSDSDAWFTDNNGVGGNVFRWLLRFLDLMEKFPNVQVVLHSSWRYCWKTDSELFQNVPESLVKLIVATTGREIIGRWESIQAYIKKHNIVKFVVLDDMRYEFPWDLEQLVWCKPTKGISDPDTFNKLATKLEEISN
jgi:HAD domain in Swiss Army Knife RNA repair proteins